MSLKVQIFWTAIVILGSVILTALFAAGQEQPVMPMPPASAKGAPRCTVAKVAYEEHWDAKTGELKTTDFRFRAEPSVGKWKLPKQLTSAGWRNGALVSDANTFDDALAVCREWVDQVEASRKDVKVAKR